VDSPQESRRAWFVGGGLLLASVVVGVGTQPLVSLVEGGTLVGTALFSSALVVFAVGLRGHGSVVGRDARGVIAMCGLAAWSFLVPLVERIVVGDTHTAAIVGFGYVDSIVQFGLAAVVVIQIVRAAVAPRPWSWIPVWVLAVVAMVWIVEQIVGELAPSSVSLSVALMTLEGLVRVGAPVLLGTVAIACASAAQSRAERPHSVGPTSA
jgi:hypothetical protein